MELYLAITIVVLLVILLFIEVRRYQIVKQLKNSDNTHPSKQAHKSKPSNEIRINECEALQENIDEELSKLRRYNTYTLTLMDFSINADAHDVAHKLKDFVRKSDRVFTCQNKIYLFFPFTKYSNALQEKIEKRVLSHIQGHYDKEIKFVTTKFYGFKYDPELRDEEFPLVKSSS